MPTNRFPRRHAVRLVGLAQRTHLALRRRLIPYLAPYWGIEERGAGQLLARDGLSPDAPKRLEQRMLQDLGIDGVAVATSSGRTALELALRALRVGRPSRDEVVIPSYCCRGVLDPVLRTGLKPQFADIGPDLNIHRDAVRPHLGPRTLAIVAAHLGGRYLTDLDDLVDMADACGAVLIEDACQALGGATAGRRWGTTAPLGLFSFGLGKITTATAGGLLAAQNWIDPILQQAERLTPEDPEAAAARFRTVRHLGPSVRHLITPSDRLPEAPFRSAHGFHRISRLDAHLTLCQLQKLDAILQRRSRHAETVLGSLGATSALEVPGRDGPNIWTKFTVVAPTGGVAQSIRRHLFWRGIETEAMYTPLHLGHQVPPGTGGPLAYTESVFRRVFNLPIRPGLDRRQVAYIGSTLRRASCDDPTLAGRKRSP